MLCLCHSLERQRRTEWRCVCAPSTLQQGGLHSCCKIIYFRRPTACGGAKIARVVACDNRLAVPNAPPHPLPSEPEHFIYGGQASVERRRTPISAAAGHASRRHFCCRDAGRP